MSEVQPRNAPKLGTFLGVFTPTILTILGVIMFLRVGWVVGSLGLIGTLVVVFIANGITLLTCLSMSALATNMRVGVGGAYYLISRSIGLEAGGAIGIPLYLSQTLSLTLYAYGLAESLKIVWPGAEDWLRPIAVLIIIGVTLFAAKSTELTLKAQVPILVLILAAVGALFFGAEWGAGRADVWRSDATVGFWQVFAVFFPAVTGVLAGVSLSGDLKDPGKAIPTGALAAVCLGFVIYMIIPVALYHSVSAEALRSNELIWTEVASGGAWLVIPGMWGAIMSSAFGSILGAPRTLQALAKDGLAPEVFAKNDEKTGEPLFGLRISGVLALIAAIFLPGLNLVAEWVTVFFLTTYGALNLVACLEALVGDPSFRPRVRIHWVWSGVGAGGCLLAMFLINPTACFVAVLVEVTIFWVISRRTLEATWGDARSGILLSAARFVLLRLRDARFDPRNWRPHILVFAGKVQEELPMIRLATRFGQHRGIVTVMSLVIDEIQDHGDTTAITRRNQHVLDSRQMTGFCETIVVPDLRAGVLTVAQANGFAGLDSNTMLFGWPEDPGALPKLLAVTHILDQLHKCTMVYRHRDDVATQVGALQIVVWWKGKEHNGDLMLLLAHLLRGNKGWADSQIILKSVAHSVAEAEERRTEFEALLPEIRINASVEVIVASEDESVRALIQRHSQGAALVFLGLSHPVPGKEAEVAAELHKMVEGLPSTLFVRNSGPFRGRLV